MDYLITISWKDILNNIYSTYVLDRKSLVELLNMFENDKNIKQIKIEIPGSVINNLYTSFGIGDISKFVNQFN